MKKSKYIPQKFETKITEIEIRIFKLQLENSDISDYPYSTINLDSI